MIKRMNHKKVHRKESRKLELMMLKNSKGLSQEMEIKIYIEFVTLSHLALGKI
jgi:hypothetical protein